MLRTAAVSFVLLAAHVSAQCTTTTQGLGGLTGGGLFFGMRGYSALALPGGDHVVGGAFTAAGGVPASYIARWDGSSWNALGSGMNNTVGTLLLMPGGDVMAGGLFTTAGGATATHFARWDGTSWSPIGSGAEPVPGHMPNFSAMATLPNGDLVVDGNVSGGGVRTCTVMHWDGTAWNQLGGMFDDWVTAMRTAQNGDIYAVGEFQNVGGVPAAHIARWDGAAWSGVGGGFNGTGYDVIETAAGDIVACGVFSSAGGVAVSGVARWDGSSWSGYPGSFNADVRSLDELPNGDLIAAGSFSSISGVSIVGVARFDGAAWGAIGTGVNARVWEATVTENGEVALAGEFSFVGGQPSRGVALITTNCPASATTIPTGCVGPAGPVTLAVTRQAWAGGEFRSQASGFAGSALAVLVVGFGQQATPLSALHPSGIAGCDLLATTDAVALVAPVNGSAGHGFAIPRDPALAGQQLVHQFLQLDLGPLGGLSSLSGSNALAITVGSF